MDEQIESNAMHMSYEKAMHSVEMHYEAKPSKYGVIPKEIDKKEGRVSVDIDTHIYNNENRLLEPKDKKCIWCGCRCSDERIVRHLSLYKVTGKAEEALSFKIFYNQINLGEWLCHRCLKKVSDFWSWKRCGLLCLLFWVPAILAFVLMYHYDCRYISLIAPIIFAFSLVLPFFINYMIYHKLRSKANFEKIERDAAEKYEFVKYLLKEGWMYEAPHPLKEYDIKK